MKKAAAIVAPMRQPRLDAIDIRILASLQREGRLTRAALAERVDLSPTPCWERLKRLESAGYVRGYHADIAVERVAPLTVVMVEITLKQHRYEDFQKFEKHVRRVDEVLECLATGGGIDYFLKVAAPSVDAYQHLVDALLVADIGIDRYFTYIVTRAVKSVAQMPVDVAVGLSEARSSGLAAGQAEGPANDR